jgi:peptidoglycan/LPS O-acetylase OafA/YrhL
VFIVLRILAGLDGANHRDLAYWTIIGRMDQFLLGMLAAYAYSRWKTALNSRLGSVVIILLALGVLYGFHRLGGWPVNASWKILWPTVEGLAWASIIVAYLKISQHLPARLSYWLTLPGLISYSLYLLHFSVISIVITQGAYRGFGLSPSIAALLNTLLWLRLICALASLTYHCVEKPFLRLRLRYHRIE